MTAWHTYLDSIVEKKQSDVFGAIPVKDIRAYLVAHLKYYSGRCKELEKELATLKCSKPECSWRQR